MVFRNCDLYFICVSIVGRSAGRGGAHLALQILQDLEKIWPRLRTPGES